MSDTKDNYETIASTGKCPPGTEANYLGECLPVQEPKKQELSLDQLLPAEDAEENDA